MNSSRPTSAISRRRPTTSSSLASRSRSASTRSTTALLHSGAQVLLLHAPNRLEIEKPGEAEDLELGLLPRVTCKQAAAARDHLEPQCRRGLVEDNQVDSRSERREARPQRALFVPGRVPPEEDGDVEVAQRAAGPVSAGPERVDEPHVLISGQDLHRTGICVATHARHDTNPLRRRQASRMPSSAAGRLARHGRSKTNASAPSTPRSVTDRSSLSAAPSPAASRVPFTCAAPRAIWIQACRPGARAYTTSSPGDRRARWTRTSWWILTEPSRPSRDPTRRSPAAGNERCS